MSWGGEPFQPQQEQPETQGDDRLHEGVPTTVAVAEEWERAVSEAMNTVRHALDLAHERIQSLTGENGELRARLDRVAAALHDPIERQG